jgi:hypothetical protein
MQRILRILKIPLVNIAHELTRSGMKPIYQPRCFDIAAAIAFSSFAVDPI